VDREKDARGGGKGREVGAGVEIGVFESPGKEWDEFVSRYSDLIFYQSAWSGILKKGFGGQPLYFYLKEGGEIVAGLPGVLLNLRILRVLYASLPYGNLVGKREYFPFFQAELEREFAERGIHQVRITDSPFQENWVPGPGFEGVQTVCTLVDLNGMDEESLLKSYGHYVRRDIKRARKNGIVVVKGESKEDFSALYELYLKAMERNRAPAKYSQQLVTAVQEFIAVGRRGALFIAKMDETPVAGILLIYSESATHAFLAGSDSRFLKFYPNKFLIHEAIRESVVRRHAVFDFMGSDKEDQDLIRFKSMWGGRAVSVTTYVKDYSPFRCWLWDKSRSFIHTSLGSRLTRAFRNRAQG
jgi:serine/alanine adding enzyme